jgi:hypothetical protein
MDDAGGKSLRSSAQFFGYSHWEKMQTSKTLKSQNNLRVPVRAH